MTTWPGANLSADEAQAASFQMADTLLSPAFRSLLMSDPAPVLRRVACPVLAVGGELDVQVDSVTNLTAIRRALPQATVKMIPRGNHLLQESTTGAIEEYELLDHAVAPPVLDLVCDWLSSKLL